MLTILRNATKGWTAKILLILLVGSFAVWGVSGTMLQGVGNAVISVGDTKVGLIEYRLAYDRQLNRLQRQFGTRITREQADGFGLKNNVISQLVSGALLDENARKMGLGISKDKLATLIGDDDSFRDATGNFSRAQLQQVLRSVGMSEDQYVETRRAVAVRNLLIQGTAGKIDLPDAYWKLLAKYEAEERVFDFVTITDKDIAAITPPTDDQIKKYYDDNLSDYRAPEFRKLDIVKLEAADIADEDAVTKDDIKADYESRKSSFTTAEKRTIEQLVFTDAAKAEAALEKLKSGDSFDDILASEGKSEKDVLLGTLAKSEIPDTKIADAAFALDLNKTSDLIDGLFGKVILRVTKIDESKTRPLNEVEGEIRKAIALSNAANDIFDTHDRLEDERAAGENLAAAAKNVGLPVRVINAIDRTSRDMDGNIINDIPESQKLLAGAFETDEGVEADPISIGTDGFVWFEVVDVVPERQKTLEEVNEQVTADWIDNEKSKAVLALAQEVRTKLNDGASFNAVLAELLPAAEGQPPRLAQTSPAVKRNGKVIGLSASAISAGFNIPKGAAIIESDEQGAQQTVLQVNSVEAGNIKPVTDADKQQLNTLLSDDLVSQMVARIKQDQNVEINQQAIAAALAYN